MHAPGPVRRPLPGAGAGVSALKSNEAETWQASRIRGRRDERRGVREEEEVEVEEKEACLDTLTV